MALTGFKKKALIILALAVLLILSFQLTKLFVTNEYKNFTKQKNIKRVIQCVDNEEQGEQFFVFQFMPRVTFAFRWVREWDSESFDMRYYSRRSEVDVSSPFAFAAPDFNAVLVAFEGLAEYNFTEMHAGYLLEADTYFSFFEDQELIDGEIYNDLRTQLGGALSIHRFDGRVFAGIYVANRIFSEVYTCVEVDETTAFIARFTAGIEAHDATQVGNFDALNLRLEEARKF